MKTINVTNNSELCKPAKHRLQKYSVGSTSLVVISGVLGSTAICSAVVVNLNLDGPQVDQTLLAGGGGTAGNSATYLFDVSTTNTTDNFKFYGDPASGNRICLVGGIFTEGTGFPPSPIFYSIGSSVNGSGGDTGYGYVYRGDSGGAQGAWTTDRIGAIGIKTGENQLGFFNVSWSVAAKTLTILGGSIESTPGASITVTAPIPEPLEFTAALGLGALGLVYYRRRKGIKTRVKN